MKKNFIHATADAIYAATDPTRQPKFGFNMGTYRSNMPTIYSDQTKHGCGTTLCIAGWMAVLDGNRARQNGAIRRAAKRAAGLTETQAENLFSPYLADGLCSVQPLQVVRVLRHFAETGEIDWSLPAA